MNDEGVSRSAPDTPGLLIIDATKFHPIPVKQIYVKTLPSVVFAYLSQTYFKRPTNFFGHNYSDIAMNLKVLRYIISKHIFQKMFNTKFYASADWGMKNEMSFVTYIKETS